MHFRRLNMERRQPTVEDRRVSAGRGLLIAACVCTLFPGRLLLAQIQVGVSLDEHAYLTGEAFTVRVRVENRLAVPMVMDNDYHNAELLIELVRRRGGAAPETQRRPVSRDTVIMPEQMAVELVEITSLFDIRDLGGYQVRAAIRYAGQLYLSQPVAFDLVRGVEIHSARRGLPGYHDIELLYSLRYWRRGGGEQAFMVIEDAAKGSIYGTFVLGPLVRVTQPAIRFDGQGRAVSVHQSGRNRFTRSVFTVDPGGAAMTDRTHHLPDGQPYPGSVRPAAAEGE